MLGELLWEGALGLQSKVRRHVEHRAKENIYLYTYLPQDPDLFTEDEA